MALGDVGAFSPAESHYGTPRAYDKMLQAEASKRASYLASMDQFYENLAEAERQFNETLEFKTETRDLELDWAREKQANELTFEREALASRERYNERSLDLKEREIAGGESDLTSFERFKLLNMFEAEGRSRRDTREEGLDLLRPGSGSETIYGENYVNPYTGRRRDGSLPGSPSSGEVDFPTDYGGSAADIPGGRRTTDYDYP